MAVGIKMMNLNFVLGVRLEARHVDGGHCRVLRGEPQGLAVVLLHFVLKRVQFFI